MGEAKGRPVGRPPVQRQTSAGGVLVRDGEQGREVLLASRRVRSGKLVWGLPKGLVEEDESPEDAAVREVREETGFDGVVVRSLGDISYWFVWEGTRVHKTVHFFLLEAAGGDPSRRDAEMEEVKWFPFKEAERIAGFKSEREVIRKATVTS